MNNKINNTLLKELKKEDLLQVNGGNIYYKIGYYCGKTLREILG